MSTVKSFFAAASLAVALPALVTGCAAFGKRGSAAEEQDPRDAQLQEMRGLVSSLSTRLDAIESKMGALNDKVDSTQANLEVMMTRPGSKSASGASSGALKKSGVSPHPADGLGASVPVEAAAGDSEAGFITDDAVLAYRRANVLFQAGKYPESVLAFSNFVERYPDHPLAGSAQYFVGASYLKQKEYKLASQELERVLTSYDRSPRVSDTLRDLADAEDALKKPKEAARHRQLLATMFPQSPAAAGPKSLPQDVPTAPITAPLNGADETHPATENTE